MILVDTCVWVDHLHGADDRLVDLLGAEEVVVHPMVTGELALGRVRERAAVLALLDDLRALPQVGAGEVRALVDRRQLWGSGLSLVDAHLLASVLITSGARLWTRDRRLAEAAHRLGVATPTW